MPGARPIGLLGRARAGQVERGQSEPPDIALWGLLAVLTALDVMLMVVAAPLLFQPGLLPYLGTQAILTVALAGIGFAIETG